MRVRLDGGWVEVEEHGSGIAVIMVHGFPLSSEIWAPVRPALASVARVITPDLLGFGRSDKPARSCSIDDLVDEVLATAGCLGVDRFVAVGHSMGGYIALSLAERHRERLVGLVLVDTRAEADDDAGRQRRDVAIRQVQDGGRSDFLDAFLPNLVGATTRGRAARLLGDLRAIADDVPDHVLIACMEAMRDRRDRGTLLHSLDLPTLVMVGEEDSVTPPELARQMVERLPRGTLSVIPGAGHTPSVERPIAFAQTLTSFLVELPGD